MARSDWYYPNIPIEMADALDDILKKQGRKYGYTNKHELIRAILAEFISKFEEKNDIIMARNAVRLDSKRDGMKPITRQP